MLKPNDSRCGKKSKSRAVGFRHGGRRRQIAQVLWSWNHCKNGLCCSSHFAIKIHHVDHFNEMLTESSNLPARRSVAKSMGIPHYFTGKPCKRGHVSPRIVSSGNCVDCNYAIATDWRLANQEKSKTACRSWYARNANISNEIARKWRMNNQSKFREIQSNWRIRNLERCRAILADWRLLNKDKIKASRKAWAHQNRERILSANANYRAQKRNSPGSHSHKEILSLLARQKFRCVNCSANIKSNRHIDHIMPLSLGGSNSIENLQALCPRCNISKGALHPVDWAQMNGRLI